MRVAYLVSEYPALSHVFIEREIEGLRARGAHVDTMSVRPTPEGDLLSEQMRREHAGTYVVLDSHAAVLRTAADVLRRHPAVAARVLRQAARTGERTLRSRTWQLFYLAEACRLYAELSRRGVRHLHVHLANNAADIARLVVALGEGIEGPDAGWRWTFTMHGPTEFEAVERFDLAAKVRSAAGVACISDFTRSQLMRLTGPSEWPWLHVVRMSVDVDRFPLVERPDRGDAPLRVLGVGRLVPEKGAPVLLEAVAALAAAGVRTEVRLVGSGDLRDLLERRIDELGLRDTVALVGAVGQDELPAHYAWADVFCLPSFQEGLPVVLMEAMATGLPVVTTAIAGIPELVEDGVNGRVLPPGRADLLAQALQDLAGDPDRRTSWGMRGREVVTERFSVEATSADQLAFLEQAQAR